MAGILAWAIGICAMAFPAPAVGAEPPAAHGLMAKPGLLDRSPKRLNAGGADDRAQAHAELIQGGADSLPALRRMLHDADAGPRHEAFEIIRQLGPCAVPLLVESLQRDEAAMRLQAAGILIDLAPDKR